MVGSIYRSRSWNLHLANPGRYGQGLVMKTDEITILDCIEMWLKDNDIEYLYRNARQPWIGIRGSGVCLDIYIDGEVVTVERKIGTRRAWTLRDHLDVSSDTLWTELGLRITETNSEAVSRKASPLPEANHRC